MRNIEVKKKHDEMKKKETKTWIAIRRAVNVDFAVHLSMYESVEWPPESGNTIERQ